MTPKTRDERIAAAWADHWHKHIMNSWDGNDHTPNKRSFYDGYNANPDSKIVDDMIQCLELFSNFDLAKELLQKIKQARAK